MRRLKYAIALLRAMGAFLWNFRHINRYSLWLHGLAVIDQSGKREEALHFLATTKRALVYLRAHDPRRFRRAMTYLKGIINVSGHKKKPKSIAFYDRISRSCSIDYVQFLPDDHSSEVLNLTAKFLACILVHEATHGYLHARGFAYTPEDREQHERICHTEEMRFAKKLGEDFYRSYNDDFDPSYWAEDWEERDKREAQT